MAPSNPFTSAKKAAKDLPTDGDAPKAASSPELIERAAIELDAQRPLAPDAINELGPMSHDEIVARLQQAAAIEASARKKPQIWHALSFWLQWAGVVAALVLLGVFATVYQDASPVALLLVGGLTLLFTLVVAGISFGLIGPTAVDGTFKRRVDRPSSEQTGALAGAENLSALGLAEDMLNSDNDPRIITQRDGVVVFANRAYVDIASRAGLMQKTKLPPRIDRLFSQRGEEATKVFKLCRAAKSGEAAEEVLNQTLDEEAGAPRRRIHVSLRALPGRSDFIAWHLRELPTDDTQFDRLAAAYADFPTPVIGVERSGELAFVNASARTQLGAGRGHLNHIDDIVLGETDELVRAIWQLDQQENNAKIRIQNDDPQDAVLVPFRRGGVGEGYACVKIEVEEIEEVDDQLNVSSDIRDAPVGVALISGDITKDGRIEEVNRTFSDNFGGVKKSALLNKVLTPDVLAQISTELRRRAKNGAMPRPVEQTIGSGADAKTFSVYVRPVQRKRGGYGNRRAFIYTVDVTDRKRMEAENAQDQKLKGIGQLASKVAHDFNNYLQAVIGHCDLLMLRHPFGDPDYQDLIEIRENAQRSANLTKQLLAFSRKQTFSPEVQSITEVLRDFTRFLQRTIGEKVSLDLINGRDLPDIKVDRRQLETAIMNLAVNARDAMTPNGGTLTISTHHIKGDELEAHGVSHLEPQDYLCINVADNGPGIKPEVAEKIFDPFFTTKEEGKGTGLGLSTVYGIVGQMGGAIILDTEVGRGATFKIYLPAYDPELEEVAEPAQEKAQSDASPVDGPAPIDALVSVSAAEKPAGRTREAPPPTAPDVTGGGHILVVEDEDSVRNFVVACLKNCGYEVSFACDGEEGLEMIEEDGDAFDLILTDVMMPIMDGPSMITEARDSTDIDAKIIFMSGYAEAGVRDQLAGIDDAGYIQKPFTLNAIATKIKETMAAAAVQ